MAKRVEFPKLSVDDWKSLADRQEGRCALSGEPLNESAQAHHVLPAGHGGRRTPETDSFVGDINRNCVLVNDERSVGAGRATGPHLEAHGGNFNNGPALTHNEFKYSHGSNTQAHAAWAKENDAFVNGEVYGQESDRARDQAARELDDEAALHEKVERGERAGLGPELDSAKERGQSRDRADREERDR